jgi:hypothetical protein
MKTNSTFKKIMIFSMIGICGINLMPRKSHAIVGLATGMVPLMIVGGGLIVSVPLIDAIGNDDPLLQIFWTFFGAISGIVLLDDQHQVTPHFSALNAQSAQSLQIDPATEMTAYNEALPTINAINQTIVSETNQYNKPEVSLDQVATFVTQEWNTYSAVLSPAALSALKKVQANVGATVNQAQAQMNVSQN